MSKVEEFIEICKAISKNKKIIHHHNATPSIIIQDGRIVELSVHQHALKLYQYRGEKNPLCWKRMWHETIYKDVESITTDSMLKGLFFESLCIGKTAHGAVTDLPRKIRDGSKTIDQIRIEEQAFLFKSLIAKEKYGIILVPDGFGGFKNVQISHKKKVEIENLEGFNVFLRGTADIISPVKFDKYDYKNAAIDLKLTKDRDSDYGDYCWGAPDRMDHMQAFVYSFLFDMPFFYWIFDYKPSDRGQKVIPVNTNVFHPERKKSNEAKLRLNEMHEAIRSYTYAVIENEANGWPTNPAYSRCKLCQVPDCPDREDIQEV